MKVLVLMDSFKGSLTAEQACDAVQNGLLRASQDIEVKTCPIADGGEGTVEALMTSLNARWIPAKVMGPLPEMQVEAGFAWCEDTRIAIVEMAKASGLPLITPAQRNPMNTTTYGTGQLIRLACELNPKKIVLAVGGSATVDGGVGAAMALGWKFESENGESVPFGAKGLENIERIIPPADFSLPTVEVLSDVENPLCGELGAARVFGPQKGADPQMVIKLESDLTRLAGLVKTQLGIDMDVPRGGAAGGLGAGALAFMNADLVSGIDCVIDLLSLDDAVQNADWVITGEGKFDSQSLNGKVVSGISKLALKHGKDTAVLAGMVDIDARIYQDHGIKDAIGCVEKGADINDAIANAGRNLEKAANRLAQKHF